MLESAGNSQNTASAAWDTFTTLLEYKCKREGTHFVEGEPAGTTKECASCGVESDKPLWVREHSYPVCGFEMDRDANANAAINILLSRFREARTGTVRSHNVVRETQSLVITKIFDFRTTCGDCTSSVHLVG
jgi:Transposase and inactivated derivatives